MFSTGTQFGYKINFLPLLSNNILLEGSLTFSFTVHYAGEIGSFWLDPCVWCKVTLHLMGCKVTSSSQFAQNLLGFSTESFIPWALSSVLGKPPRLFSLAMCPMG